MVMVKRQNIRPKIKKVAPDREALEPYEVIEFEVNGRVINRVKKNKAEVKDRLEDFYAQYGRYGQAYIIRESKMNFKSMMED